jgi:hypothetical protein
MMGATDPKSGWPDEGGRSFARGTWIDIGPFTYRNRWWRRATKITALLVLAFMTATGVLFLVITVLGR